MTRAEAERTFETISRTAKDTLEKDGNHRMISIVYSPKKEVNVIDLTGILAAADKLHKSGQDTEAAFAKDAGAEIIRVTLKQLNAIGVITICEAWVSKAKPKELLTLGGDEPGRGRAEFRGVMPRNDPKRQEALNVVYEFKVSDGPKYQGMRMWVFRRNGGKITFEKPVDTHENMGGRFVDLLEE